MYQTEAAATAVDPAAVFTGVIREEESQLTAVAMAFHRSIQKALDCQTFIASLFTKGTGIAANEKKKKKGKKNI